jgi:4-amino-4-deoxychorismate lyase
VPVYFNGRLLPAGEARVPITDHGLLYGLGFFETFRTSGGRPHAWERHCRRLRGACERAGIVLPASFLAVAEPRLREVVRDALVGSGMAEAVFRYSVTAGAPSPDGRYEQPGEWLVLRPLPVPAAEEGVTLRELKLARDTGEWVPRPKSLNFANALLGGNELRRRATRRDDEGLFLARDTGFVVEAAWHNLAWIERGGGICFPDPALGGVAGTCLEWVRQRPAGATARRIRMDDLAKAEAVVLLNAVRGVTPVRRLWDAGDLWLRAEWSSSAHPVVVALRQEWNASLRATAEAGNQETGSQG